MSANIKDISLNCEIMSELIGFEFIFLKIYKNVIVLPIYQRNNLVSDRKIDLLKINTA